MSCSDSILSHSHCSIL